MTDHKSIIHNCHQYSDFCGKLFIGHKADKDAWIVDSWLLGLVTITLIWKSANESHHNSYC